MPHPIPTLCECQDAIVMALYAASLLSGEGLDVSTGHLLA